MNSKFTDDVEKLQQENEEQMQEQEKRLQNMANAKLEQLKHDNSDHLSQLKATFQQKERELQQSKAQTQAEMQREIRQLDEQIQQLEARGSGRKRKKSGKTVRIVSNQGHTQKGQLPSPRPSEICTPT